MLKTHTLYFKCEEQREENYRHTSSSPLRVAHTSPGEMLETFEMVSYALLPVGADICTLSLPSHVKYSTSLFTLQSFQKAPLFLSNAPRAQCLGLCSSGIAVTQGNLTSVVFHIKEEE